MGDVLVVDPDMLSMAFLVKSFFIVEKRFSAIRKKGMLIYNKGQNFIKVGN